MDDAYNKIARILRTEPEILLHMDQMMSALTGQEGVLEAVSKENDILVDRTLQELGLSRNSTAEEVYLGLLGRLINLDIRLADLLEHPNLSDMSQRCGKLCETAFKVFTPPRGMFIKRERAVHLLEKFPPAIMLEHFGYKTVSELIEKEGFSSVMCGLRFVQPNDWMHKFFDEAYTELKADDFEERDVELKVLEDKWLKAGEKFMKHKHHNISHLKEYGIIFIVPIPIDVPGETMRMFTLILHYLHEVPFYASLIRKFLNDADFSIKLKSLLRGDVPKGPAPDGDKMVWRVVQQYLAKDDENDFRLLEPHVNPEADHWYRAEEDLGRLSRMIGSDTGSVSLGYWTGLDFVGDVFKNTRGEEVLVSFDLIDLIMSLVDKTKVKYLYHQQEALWNKIFVEYLGRERMDRLIEENIISGFIQLK